MLRFITGRHAQLLRFCLVGAICFVANILALAFLCELLGVHYIVAYVLVFFLGNSLGYWLNKHFTFAVRARLDRTSLLRYLIINFVMLVIGTAALHVLVESLRMNYLIAATIIAGLIAPASFVVHRLVTYRIAT